MDGIFKMTIALLNTVHSKESIQNYVDSLSEQMNAQISDMSVSNLKAALILHAIATSQKELYLDSIKVGKLNLDDYSVPESVLSGIGEFIDDCIVNLKIAQFYIEDSLDIEYQTLDIFEPNTTEGKLDIHSSENTDPIYLNFFTSRQFAIKNSSILKRFTDFKKDITQSCESLKQTSVIRNGTVSVAIVDGIGSMISYYNMLKSLRESGNFAIMAYDTYGFHSKDDVARFTGRTYIEIKKDLEVFV